MASKQYFNFIGNVWNYLPEEEKTRMGETWKAYEQTVAAAYQNFVEVDLNIALDTMNSYSTERWLPYSFNADSFVDRPAILNGNQDLSEGVNLSVRYLIRVSIDNATPIEVDLRGANPSSTTIAEVKENFNIAAGFEFARGIFEDSVIQLVSSTTGVGSKIKLLVPSDPSKDATEFVFGFLQTELPIEVPTHPYAHLLPYPKIVNIPDLRDSIRDESVESTLTENVDYIIEGNGIISFKTPPPESMWARRTLFDEEVPYNNFGFLMEIYQKNTPSYKTAMQGLWYAFWTGPKPENLRRALYLLFGLPTALEDTVVTEVTPSSITTVSSEGVTRFFEIPPSLVAIVAVGQAVTKFEPLVDGIEVFDKVSKPGFITDEIGRKGIQRFLLPEATRGLGDTDETKALTMLEEHTFLPQISVDAFISPDISLGNVKTFLQQIRPLNKTTLFQVIVGQFNDELAIDDKLFFDIGIDITPNLDSNQTTFLEQVDLDTYETVDNDALNLDSDGVLTEESVEVDVYSFAVLIDSFVA